MAQQINLNDPRFAPVQLRLSARHALLAAALVLVLGWGGAQGLQVAAQQALGSAQAVQAGSTALRGQVAALSARQATAATTAELQRLQAADASQRQVRAALDAGAAGVREGHAALLQALARQAPGQVWITALAVSDDGSAIDLEGRMRDSSVLADYLRRLNDEPRFKGRPFAQLNLKSVDANGSALPYTEFALRSSSSGAAGSTGSKPGSTP